MGERPADPGEPRSGIWGREAVAELRGPSTGRSARRCSGPFEAGRMEPILQIAGNGLLVAMAQGMAGAREACARCAVLLRERCWDGDKDLAGQLEGALGAGPAPMLRALPVDLEELSMVLEGDPIHGGGRIDLRTGETWPTGTEDVWREEFGEEDGSRPAHAYASPPARSSVRSQRGPLDVSPRSLAPSSMRSSYVSMVPRSSPSARAVARWIASRVLSNRGSSTPAASRMRSSTATRSTRRSASRTLESASGPRWRTARRASARRSEEETRRPGRRPRKARSAPDSGSGTTILTKAELSRYRAVIRLDPRRPDPRGDGSRVGAAPARSPAGRRPPRGSFPPPPGGQGRGSGL